MEKKFHFVYEASLYLEKLKEKDWDMPPNNECLYNEILRERILNCIRRFILNDHFYLF